jgi:hypothetical protein
MARWSSADGRPGGPDTRRVTGSRVLRGTFNLPAGAVEVGVRDGVVTLSGQVPWRSGAEEIVEGVLAMAGVVDVVDRLSWAHDDTASPAATPWARAGASPGG